MQTALAPRGDARTFLTHFVGGSLEDDRYVVARFRSLANGEIVLVQAGGTKPKGRRRARGEILPLKAVETMRPARDKLIIATGVRLRHCGTGAAWGFSPTAARRADSALVRTSRRRAGVRRNAIIALRCAVESNRFDDFRERRAAAIP